MENSYTQSRFNRVRRKTSEVMVGNVGIGGNNPIRIQSMTNTKTCDVAASVAQCIQLAEAGCEIIRLTAQNLDAARALKDISKQFRAAGFSNPLVADIHFLPQTAMEAVEHVEKIRVNPGNFSDKKKSVPVEYTDSLYAEELDKVREKFTPLVLRCKELGRAMRIGTNHGSLSDRIVSRYGDTSFGMVEAALEFARICEDLNFKNLVFSFKSSNTRVMIDTYRLAAKMMAQEGMNYPLHLGVTEAGFGRDARIKSAIGIGSLLLDGLGDTIRVSLTEDPVQELPVAREIARIASLADSDTPSEQIAEDIDFYSYKRRAAQLVEISDKVKVGAGTIPSVIEIVGQDKNASEAAEVSVKKNSCGAYVGGGLIIKKYSTPSELESDLSANPDKIIAAEISSAKIDSFADVLKNALKRIIIVPSDAQGKDHAVGEARRIVAKLDSMGLALPVMLVFNREKLIDKNGDFDSRLDEASMYLGSLLADGIGDCVCVNISEDNLENAKIALDILQGARARKSKAEYIACPSCGRTLYNIQETAAKIKAHTEHMKGITIGIMGCIVNGPGEMADADYGYVGGAPGKINLYKAKKCVEMNIPQEEALEHLLKLIEEDMKNK